MMDPTSPEEIAETVIKQAALGYARQQGIEASEADCFITPTTRKVIIDEQTGELVVAPQTLWEVRVLPQGGAADYGRGIAVQVENLSGTVVATEFWPIA
jgi:hypothetical protein